MSRFATVVLASLACWCPIFAADEKPVPPRPWEHESSDLAPHPAIRFGALDNGVRYAWRNHSEPKGRLCVWMHVDVGSFAEEDHERGMAHFLEHMAFNGSANFPPGTLIQWLQEHGLEFGADSNARTGLSDTVYTFDLPAADAKALREGLTVLSDIAGKLSLTQEEIDAEKGVIDGEERERDSPQFRMMFDSLKEFFAGARITQRLPIGIKEARDAFSAETVRAFYEKWYRPDQLTVIVVGDLGELDPAPLITEYFGSLPKPTGPRPQEPSLGAPTFERPFQHLHEPEVPIAQIALGRYSPFQPQPYDSKMAVRDVPVDVACAMVNRRFAESTKKGKAPYLQASVSYDDMSGVYRGPVLQVIAEPSKWREAFLAAELELRSAIVHGFQDEELRIQRAERMRALDEAVRREASMPSNALAEQIASAAEERIVPVSATTMRDLRAKALDDLTTSACQAALAAAWKEGTLGLQCNGAADLGADAPALLEKLYQEAIEREPPAPQAVAATRFAYASDPARTGKVTERTTLPHDTVAVSFENGVRARVKKTDFAQREIRFSVAVGEGALSSPLSAAALRTVASDAVEGAGLAAHDADAIRRITAGRALATRFGIGEDSFTVSGSAAPDDLLLAFELAAATISHTGWRDDGLQRFRRELPTFFDQMQHSLDGPYVLGAERRLFGGDPRFSMPPLSELLAVDMKAIREWIEPVLTTGPIDIAIVGDLDVDATIAALARTFGTLPQRRERAEPPDRRATARLVPGLTIEETVTSKVPSALVLVFFQADDGIAAARRRDAHFLARVLQDRVLQVVREKLGASYSPMANEDLSNVYPGMGRFVIRAECDPGATHSVKDAAIAVATSIAKDGVSDEEIQRLREPLLAQLRDQKRRNSFWLSTLAWSFRDAHAFEDVDTAETYYLGLTKEHLAEVAKRYFQPDLASTLIVTPASSESDPSAPEKGNR